MDEQAGLIYYMSDAYVALPNTTQGLRLFRKLSDGLYYVKKHDGTLELFSLGLNMPYSVFQVVVPTNNVGAGEDTLDTNAIKGGTLAIVGSAIQAKYCVRLANTLNAKTLRLYFAGTKIFQSAHDYSGGTLFDLDLNVYIIRKDADSVGCIVSYTTNGITESQKVPVANVDFAVDNDLVLTGEAVADSDIISVFAKGMYLPNT